MAKLTAQELIDAIKEMTVLELNDLVKACEEEFGVSAAAPVMMAGPAAAPAAESGSKAVSDSDPRYAFCSTAAFDVLYVSCKYGQQGAGRGHNIWN